MGLAHNLVDSFLRVQKYIISEKSVARDESLWIQPSPKATANTSNSPQLMDFFALPNRRSHQSKFSRISTAGLLAILGTGLFHTGARALNINIIADANLAANQPALDAFNRAAAQWEAIFTDDITVNIEASLADLGPGILGGASNFNFTNISYETLALLLASDAADEADDAIVGLLPANFADLNFSLPDGITLNAAPASIPVATARALGAFSDPNQTDSVIQFSSTFDFDFDNRDGIMPGFFDFETIAVHELGHALGFTSGVNTVDVLVDQGSMGSVFLQPLDLFRVDSVLTSTADFTIATRQFTPGEFAFFADPGSPINGVEFSRGETGTNPDGNQPGHFLADEIGGETIGVLDPTFAPGQIIGISAADIRTLDLIGFDFVAATAVPFEFAPASGLAIAGSFWGLGRWRRRRQQSGDTDRTPKNDKNELA